MLRLNHNTFPNNPYNFHFFGVVSGQVVSGQVVSGQVVNGQVVKGQVVKGQVVKDQWSRVNGPTCVSTYLHYITKQCTNIIYILTIISERIE